MMKKSFLVMVALGAVASLVPVRVEAATRCETQYGGGETCREVETLILDKKIKDPRNGEFRDHLADVTPDGYRFALGEQIIFKIRVKNESDHKIDEVNVIDTLPSGEVKLAFADSLSFKIYDLEKGETEERTIVAKVASDSAVLNSFACTENVVEAWGGGEYRRDTARFCVAKTKVLGITTLPKTGWVGLIFAVLLALSSAFAGFLLIRLNRKP